jgi:AsmA protein
MMTRIVVASIAEGLIKIMKGIAKWIVGIVVVVLLLVIAVMIVAVVVFDPDDYREVVAELVYDQTGRTLEIEGGLSINVLPCCSVALKETRLSNPEGFAETEFARVESVKLGLQLLPLIFRQEVLVDDIGLDGLELTLTRRADGVANWEFASEPSAPADEPETADSDIDLSTLSIGSIRIRDARVTFEDAEADMAYRVDDFDLQTGRIAVGKPVDLEMSLAAEDLKAGTSVQLRLDSKVNIDPELSALVLSGLNADADVSGGDLPAAAIALAATVDTVTYDLNAGLAKLDQLQANVDLSGGDLPADDVALAVTATTVNYDVNAGSARLEKLQANVDLTGGDLPGDKAALSADANSVGYDLNTGRADLDQLQAKLNAAGLQVDLTGNGFYSEKRAELAGELKVNSFSPREILEELEQPEIVTADPTVLQTADLTSKWSVKNTLLRLDGMAMRLDDTGIRGMAQLNYPDQSDIQFDLSVDSINLDRYLPPAADEPTAAEDEDAGAEELPIEALKELELQGQASIGQLTVSDAVLQNIKVTINAADGVLRLNPILADLYGGSYKGKMTLNVARGRPRVKFRHALTGVQMGSLLADTTETDNIEGLLTASFEGAGLARNANQLLKTLDGDVSLDLADGIYKGVDVWYEIRKARALLKGAPPPAASADPQTPITAMDLKGQIDKGQLNSDRLLLELPFIRLDGNGTTNLVKQNMDYRFNARVFGKPDFGDGEDLSDLAKFTIPLTISGDVAGPKIGVDLASLAKDAAVQKGKDILLKKLGLDEPESQDEAATQGDETSDQPQQESTEDVLKKGLRDIFKKP